ncbi:hypothetical protein GQ457_07G018550 [Hibiscus cannabinus]
MSQFRRVLSLLARSQPQTSLFKESPSPAISSASVSFGSRYDIFRRWLQNQPDPSSQANDNTVNHEADSSNPTSCLANVPTEMSDSAVKQTAMSNLKTSARHDLAMVFTCKVCETRSVKTVCRESYEKGVVVVRCGGCSNLHLIADRLGWFGEPGSIEDYLAARGEEVKKGSADTLNLTLEDLAGKGTI